MLRASDNNLWTNLSCHYGIRTSLSGRRPRPDISSATASSLLRPFTCPLSFPCIPLICSYSNLLAAVCVACTLGPTLLCMHVSCRAACAEPHAA
jgi:hypothetical protein